MIWPPGSGRGGFGTVPKPYHEDAGTPQGRAAAIGSRPRRDQPAVPAPSGPRTEVTVSELTLTVYSVTRLQVVTQGNYGFDQGVVGRADRHIVCDLVVGDDHIYLVRVRSPGLVSVELGA